MITYGIGDLPLIRDIQGTHPPGTQPWYADDMGWEGKFPHILAHLQDFQARGPPRGYFLEPTKSILVVAQGNMDRAEEFFRGMGLKFVKGSWYLGGFIGYGAAEKRWLARKVEGWVESVGTLAGV